MAKPQDGHAKGRESRSAQGTAQIYTFPRAGERPKRKRQPVATAQELEEYRAMLPKLRAMLKEWDEIKRKVELGALVDEHSVLAHAILKGDTL